MGRQSKKWTGKLGKPIIYNSFRKSDNVEKQMRERIGELCDLLKVDKSSPNLTTDLLLALLQKEVPGFQFKDIENGIYENSEDALRFYADIGKILLANPNMTQMDAFAEYNVITGYERDVESLNTIYHDIRKHNHYISEILKSFDILFDEKMQIPDRKKLKEQCVNEHVVGYVAILDKLKGCKTEEERNKILRSWCPVFYDIMYTDKYKTISQ